MDRLTRICTASLVLASFVSPLAGAEIVPASPAVRGTSATYETDISARLASIESELESLRETQYAPAFVDTGDVYTDSSPGVIAGVEFLYLNAKRRGLDFAISDPNTDNNIEGVVQSLGLEANGGVRGSVGYRTCRGWEIVFTYTHFDTSDHRSISAPAGGRLWMTRTNPASTNNDAARAEATAELNYDVFDLEAAYWIHPRPYLPIRLFGGVRGATIQEIVDAEYSGGTVVGTRIQTQRSQLDAYGLRAGAETYWQLCCGLSVFGRAAGSVLVGDFAISDTENESQFGGQGDVAVAYDYDDILPVLDAAVGVSWQPGAFTWQAGYELTAFLNSDTRVNFTGAESINRGQLTNAGSDLGLEGLFVRIVYSR